jgi:hypothetical protein
MAYVPATRDWAGMDPRSICFTNLPQARRKTKLGLPKYTIESLSMNHAILVQKYLVIKPWFFCASCRVTTPKYFCRSCWGAKAANKKYYCVGTAIDVQSLSDYLSRVALVRKTIGKNITRSSVRRRRNFP